MLEPADARVGALSNFDFREVTLGRGLWSGGEGSPTEDFSSFFGSFSFRSRFAAMAAARDSLNACGLMKTARAALMLIVGAVLLSVEDIMGD